MRVATVLSVVIVHSLSILVPEDGGPAGAVLMVFHSSREVFLLLSALVLTYTASSSTVAPLRFWRRRFPIIAAPYAVWTLIYFLTDGDLVSPGSALSRLGLDLLTGDARYQLYFVLLTFQLYLIFPWLLRWLRARQGRLARMVAISLVLQLGFTALSYWRLPAPPPLVWLSDRPGSWLPAYQLYVVAGVAVGIKIGDVAAWCELHVRALVATTLGVVGASLVWYAVSVRMLGTGPVQASTVFQPAVVIESLVIAALELGVFQAWSARASERTLRTVATGADVSFGIYFLHPLLLELAVDAAARPELAKLPPVAAVAVITLLVAPLLLILAGTAVWLARRTPLSLALCGRPRRESRTVGDLVPARPAATGPRQAGPALPAFHPLAPTRALAASTAAEAPVRAV